MTFAPLSIPSPPPEFKAFSIPLGEWLHGIIPAVPETFAVNITAYALCILTGIVVALLITNHRLTRRGGEPWVIIDLTLWGIVFGLIGARVWHVATHLDDYFGPGKLGFGVDFADGSSVWSINQGGVAIFGTLLFGALGYYIGARQKGLRFLSVADAIVPGLMIAQALGRLGNWFNQELFGLPTDLPWGLEIDRPNAAIPVGLGDDVLFHPTFIYEMTWNVVGALVIVFLIENTVRLVRTTPAPADWPKFLTDRVIVDKEPTFFGRFLPFTIRLDRRGEWQWGKVLGLYLIWYGIGRSWFESIRLDPSETFFGIRSNVWGALAAILLGIVIIAVQSRRHPGIEPSPYVSGQDWVDPAEVDSEDTYSDTEPGDDAPAETGQNPKVPATSGKSGKP